jgi:hypothetical protein
MCQVHIFSEPGGHAENEDVINVCRHPQQAGVWLCALADGQGGRCGGARAAELACRTVIQAAVEYRHEVLTIGDTWVEILRLADLAVAHDEDAGLATLVGFCLTKGTLVGASNGDSAVMVLDTAQDCREITRGQHKNPPIGFGDATIVPFTTRLVKPWTVMTMSDGVWKYVGWDRIREHATRLRGQALIESLQQAGRLARTGVFQDDFTLGVFNNEN